MSSISWEQTFKNNDGVVLKNAKINIYLSNTNTAARIFDVNGSLTDSVPQTYTDGNGFIEVYLDTDDYTSGQLFDVYCVPDVKYSSDDEIRLPSMMLLQDVEGSRNFKNIFTQNNIPTEGVRQNDLWFDVDDNNHPYTYNGSSWISTRDGSIAVAGTTSNWSLVIDDDAHKPENDADVTSNNTANNTTYVNGSITQTGQSYICNGDLKIDQGTLKFYDSVSVFCGNLIGYYAVGPSIASTTHFIPNTTNSYDLGCSTRRWKEIFLSASGIDISDKILIYNDTYNYINIKTNDFKIYDYDNTKDMISCVIGGGVSLYYDGVEKLKTTISGTDIPVINTNTLNIDSNLYITTSGINSTDKLYISSNEVSIDSKIYLNASGIDIDSKMELCNDTHNILNIYTDDFKIYDADNSNDMIHCSLSGGVYLYQMGDEKLRTTESGIVVTGVCTGCDYVFEEDYTLMPFDCLDSYITKNKQLPNMTINEGTSIDLNAFRKETVEKIEELSLYIIQLHKRIKKLEEGKNNDI